MNWTHPAQPRTSTPRSAFRIRPLDTGPYTFVAADALVLKVREGGRRVNVHALLGTRSERRRNGLMAGPVKY